MNTGNYRQSLSYLNNFTLTILRISLIITLTILHKCSKITLTILHFYLFLSLTFLHNSYVL